VLCILDGVGVAAGDPDNAVVTAPTPTLDELYSLQPMCTLRAHGTAVGLPSDADMGNSEVGHNAIGAGRIFDQGAKRVEEALSTGQAFEGDVWRELLTGTTLHLMGLLSDGNVHSHIRHVLMLVNQAALDGQSKLRVHILTDGRDVAGRFALRFIDTLESCLEEHRQAGLDYAIASGGGRMHLTMDRYEADWTMVARGWRVHVHGEGRAFASAREAVETFYEEDTEVNDQWLPSFVCADQDGPVGRIQSGDCVLFFNFRGDRAIEISRAFEDEAFTCFDRGPRLDVTYAGMMQYDGDLHLPARFLVAPPAIDRTVGEYLVANNKRSFVVSETQKFGHVTYFFNGNRSGTLDDALERYVEVPSDTRPLEERPWMKAAEITDEAVAAIQSGTYDHVRLNLANGDMVGHTGDLRAARLAMSAVDLCVQRLVRAVQKAEGVLIITADHGNADRMWMRAKDGSTQRAVDGTPVPHMAHTLAPVPVVLIDPTGLRILQAAPQAGIASLGTTILNLCGLSSPDGYVEGLAITRPDWEATS
jgi:2,3-bisphosphoglycerate-independent phosphoglycerate mutase